MSQASPATADLADALETIRSEYGDEYGEWLRFAGDATDHARDEMGLDVEFFPPDMHMPVVRYQQTPAEDLRDTSFGELTDDHLTALIGFAETL